MPTFKEQVQGMTSISVGTTPTDDELSQFLRDGVIDVTRRTLSMRPGDAERFMKESTESSSQGGLSTDGGQLLHVIRETGVNEDWAECRKVSIALRSEVVDPESLNFASVYNPVYTISQYGSVLVFPEPSGSTGQYKIYYVNSTPVDDASGATLAHGASTIRYFPDDKINLVVIYASLKTLQANMGSKSVDTLSITAVPPDTPSAPNFSGATVVDKVAGSLGTAPTYTKPTVSGDGDELTDVSDLASDNTIDVLNDQDQFDQWWSTAAHLIEDEEDPELAQLQLQKISTYVNAYSAEMQNELNEFNKENAIYQTTVQEALQELQIAAAKAQKDADLAQQKEIAEYSNRLQRFQNEISAYQADVSNQVQEYSAYIQEVSTEYQWLQSQYGLLKKEYDEAFGIMAPQSQGQGR